MEISGEELVTHLRELRQQKGASCQEVATEVGVDVSAVRAWEQGRYVPREKNLRRLAAALGLKITSGRELFGLGSAEDRIAVVDTINELPALLNRLLNAQPRVLRGLRLAAPYATPAFVQEKFRMAVSERIIADALEVERVEIIYGLDRLKEVLSNIFRYEGHPYYFKCYCAGVSEVVPAMGGYYFDDTDFLIGAYWTGVPPTGLPGMHLSGPSFRKYFSEYWREIWCRGTLLNIRGGHDLTAAREVALRLGLPPAEWNDFVEAARTLEIGDGAPPLA